MNYKWDDFLIEYKLQISDNEWMYDVCSFQLHLHQFKFFWSHSGLDQVSQKWTFDNKIGGLFIGRMSLLYYPSDVSRHWRVCTYIQSSFPNDSSQVLWVVTCVFVQCITLISILLVVVHVVVIVVIISIQLEKNYNNVQFLHYIRTCFKLFLFSVVICHHLFLLLTADYRLSSWCSLTFLKTTQKALCHVTDRLTDLWECDLKALNGIELNGIELLQSSSCAKEQQHT